MTSPPPVGIERHLQSAMQIIPAVDLQNGHAVRLLRGDFERETVYGTDPADVARRWREAGATLLHVVDLDGARAGRPVQLDLVRAIAAEVPVQVGGGLRTRADIDDAFAAGAHRAVIGTAALDRALVRELAATYGERLVIALDTRHGRIAVEGWTEASEWS